MNRTIALIISVALFVGMLVLIGVSRMQAQSGCSLTDFKGTYRVRSTGFLPGVPPDTVASFPFALVGIVTADGAGSARQDVTTSNNGTIGTFTDTGNYTVNPDCTGSATFPIGGTGNFVIVDKGREIFFIDTTPGRINTGGGELVSMMLTQPSCSLADLKGTYGARATGFRQGVPPAAVASTPLAAVGIVIYDGSGGYSLESTFSINGTIGTGFTDAGTYAVNPDCTGTFTSAVIGTGVPDTFFVIVDKGRVVFTMDTRPGRVTTAVHIKQ